MLFGSSVPFLAGTKLPWWAQPWLTITAVEGKSKDKYRQKNQKPNIDRQNYNLYIFTNLTSWGKIKRHILKYNNKNYNIYWQLRTNQKTNIDRDKSAEWNQIQVTINKTSIWCQCYWQYKEVNINSSTSGYEVHLSKSIDWLSRLLCYVVFCICLLTTNKYQKYKSVELGDQLWLIIDGAVLSHTEEAVECFDPSILEISQRMFGEAFRKCALFQARRDQRP